VYIAQTLVVDTGMFWTFVSCSLYTVISGVCIDSSDSSSDSDSDSDPEKDNKFASALFMMVGTDMFTE